MQKTPLNQNAKPGHVTLNLSVVLKRAIASHHSGNQAEAERLCTAILSGNADQFGGLHYFGVLEAQSGRYEEADCLLSQALAIYPQSAEALSNHGNVLKSLVRLEEALASYDQALAIRPGYAEALNNRGTVLQDLNRHEAALASFDQALAVKPDYVEAFNNRANALLDLERHKEALASCEQALSLAPDFVDALNTRAGILRELKRYEEALASCDQALTLAPDFVDALNTRGGILQGLKRHEAALANYEQALAIAPDLVEAYNNRATALLDLKRYEEALASCNKALALAPDFVAALNNRANALRDLNHYEEALAGFNQALALAPDLADALNNRGLTLIDLGRGNEANQDFERVLNLKPDYEYASGMLLNLKMKDCDWLGQTEALRHIVAGVRANQRSATPFAFLSMSDSPQDQLLCARTFARDSRLASPSSIWRGERYTHERIRVAYLSADFRGHAVAYLTAGLFEQHDRTRFETTAISFGTDNADDMEARLRHAFDRFIDVSAQSDREVAELLQKLEIDIAVDLMGITQNCRTDILALRPAPIQVNYLGYPGTMGADYMDYIIADRFVIPQDQLSYYEEQVVYLPDTFQVNDAKRKISERTPTRAEVGLPERGFVFCSFNNSYKINSTFFDVWMRLLHKVSGSVLWLVGGKASVETNLRREAAARGINPARLVFAPRIKYSEHLARYSLADLFLDTLPFNAGTTASDALWGGLPVLTCTGEAFAARMAGSLLHAIGLPELVTHSLETYEALALKLAQDGEMLSEIKAKLAHNRETYPLFDTGRYCRHIEAAYVTMWQRYQRGEPPAGFKVEPIRQS